MKILNLYAGIGGNRKLWGDEHEITAVENDLAIAEEYLHLYPKDTVWISDAHEYLLEHFAEYDFIWSSPPCPTHSKANMSLQGYGIYRYPDMRLYQEILFLKHFFKGKWVVENVDPYYAPLIEPTVKIDRHLFWSNFPIAPFETERGHNVNRATKETLAAHHGITLSREIKDQRKLLRNAVYPPVGEHVLMAGKHS